MSNRVLNLLPNAVGQGQQQVLLGTVSLLQPQPRSFSDFLYVAVDWNPGIVFQIPDWPACHGAALPAAGDLALLVKDDLENLRCVWWGSDHGTVIPTTETGGVSVQTPGVTATVVVPHGLSSTPRTFAAQAGDPNSLGAPPFYLTATGTNLVLNFSSNLAGSTTYTWVWSAHI